MGASFRNTDQILGLVGSDLLTISPNLLQSLSSMTEEPEVCLDEKNGRKNVIRLLESLLLNLVKRTFNVLLYSREPVHRGDAYSSG